MARSLLFFLVAGLCEIGGGYLFWLWLREGKSPWLGVLGTLVLAVYGIVPTLQPANFGRVYAAYGGIFVILSFFWGWKVDGVLPDRWDGLGVMLIAIGVLAMAYIPRN